MLNYISGSVQTSVSFLQWRKIVARLENNVNAAHLLLLLPAEKKNIKTDMLWSYPRLRGAEQPSCELPARIEP